MASRSWQATWSTVVLCLAVGTAAWVLLVAMPGQGETQVNAAPYFGALVACGAAVGAFLGGNPITTGALLAAPALLTAEWLAPRGDDDGLWMLWYGVILFDGGAAAVAHLVAARMRKQPPI